MRDFPNITDFLKVIMDVVLPVEKANPGARKGGCIIYLKKM